MPTMLPNIGRWGPGAVLRDSLPRCVEVFNRALSIDPAERPRDAETLVREIANAVGDDRPPFRPIRRGV